MTTEKWKKACEIFEQALEHPQGEREEIIGRACMGDDSLYARVMELMRADAREDDLFKSPLINPEEKSQSQWTGKKVGGYSIEKVLASGGMGTVFLAKQESPSRTVALKMMRLGLTSLDAARRFQFEVEVLGRLQHPNIAQIFDAGAFEEKGGGALPYFAMEYVEKARNLIEFAHENQLEIKERVQLFMEACEAIQYGHEKGVIHRDLKPGNILVDPFGRVKVIDFGVARATDPEQTPTSMRTQAGYILGTLQYMAPEQIFEGTDSVDTRSDVYGLGSVLYELLTLRPPFDLTQEALAAAARRLSEEEPVRPSRLNPKLPRDLDWILLKALAKERDRRFASVSEMIGDLKRYLQNEPVLAGPPSRRYRIARFVRRHRMAMTAASLTFLAVILGATVAILESIKARDAELQAKKTADFLSGLFVSINPFQEEGGPQTVKELLDRGANSLQQEMMDEPLVRANLKTVIGDAYRAIGEYSHAQTHITQGVSDLRRILGEGHPDLISSLITLGRLHRAQGEYKEAETLYNQIINAYTDVLGENNDKVLTCHFNLAVIYFEQSRYKEAEKKILGVIDQSDPNTLSMLNNKFHLADIYYETGRFSEAEKLHKQVLDMRQKMLPKDHPHIYNSYNNLAQVYYSQYKLDEALLLYEKALAGYRKILSPTHTNIQNTLANLAILYQKFERYEDAEAALKECLKKELSIYETDHPDVLKSYNNLGVLYLRQNRLTEAETYVKKSLQGRRRVLGEKHKETLTSLINLAGLYSCQKRYQEAEPLYKQVWEARKEVLGEHHPRTLQALYQIAIVYRNMNRIDEAGPILKAVLDGRRISLGANHNDTLVAVMSLSSFLKMKKRYQESKDLLKETLAGVPEDHALYKKLQACHENVSALIKGSEKK